jgi:hypothetical protein
MRLLARDDRRFANDRRKTVAVYRQLRFARRDGRHREASCGVRGRGPHFAARGSHDHDGIRHHRAAGVEHASGQRSGALLRRGARRESCDKERKCDEHSEKTRRPHEVPRALP